jgi:protein involved in polysaccharide export with SLBB domain
MKQRFLNKVTENPLISISVKVFVSIVFIEGAVSPVKLLSSTSKSIL